jgi:hypothetical protein
MYQSATIKSMLEISADTLWILMISLFSAAFLYFAYESYKHRTHHVKCGEMLLWLVAREVFFHFATSTSATSFIYAVLPRAVASYCSLIYTTRIFLETAIKATLEEDNHECCMSRTKAMRIHFVFDAWIRRGYDASIVGKL